MSNTKALLLRQMAANARQPVPPSPVVIPDWPLDRRTLQAEQQLDLPDPEQDFIPGTREHITHRPLAGARPNNRGMGQLLQAGDGTPQADAGRPRDPVIVFEYPKRSGEDAEDCTIVCGVVPIEDPDGTNTTLGGIFIVGLLDFGIGGVTFSTKFDFVQGTMLTVPASWARVRAFYSKIVDETQPNVSVTAAAAYYPTANANAPTFTQIPDGGVIGAGATSQTFVIPYFARVVSVQTSQAAGVAPNLRLTIFGGGLSHAVSYVNDTNLAIQNNQFQLSRSDRYITVKNLDNNNPSIFRLVYSLAM